MQSTRNRLNYAENYASTLDRSIPIVIRGRLDTAENGLNYAEINAQNYEEEKCRFLDKNYYHKNKLIKYESILLLTKCDCHFIFLVLCQ